MTYWAAPGLDRTQTLMFHPTLDAMIPADHPVRLYDEIMRGLDWSEWEAHYHSRLGQPAIHPRVMASAILDGLNRDARSTRKLEYACVYHTDLVRLTEGRVIDHSTCAIFRKRFGEELKNLFRQVGRVASDCGSPMKMGFLRLVESDS